MKLLFDSDIKFLEINNAKDDIENIHIHNLVINLYDNSIESGVIEKNYKFYRADSQDFLTNIWAKVVDNGQYYLLNEWGDPIYSHNGYVPKVLDFYNVHDGYGDYIDLTIQRIGDRYYVNHKPQSICNDYLDKEDWVKMTFENHITCAYDQGCLDTITFFKKQITNGLAVGSEPMEILNFILNYERNNT